jgi:hypothetical protein
MLLPGPAADLQRIDSTTAAQSLQRDATTRFSILLPTVKHGLNSHTL